VVVRFLLRRVNGHSQADLELYADYGLPERGWRFLDTAEALITDIWGNW
jgi:hypothetical protein